MCDLTWEHLKLLFHKLWLYVGKIFFCALFTEFIHFKITQENLTEPLDSGQLGLSFFLRSDLLQQIQNCDFFAYGNGRSKGEEPGEETTLRHWGASGYPAQLQTQLLAKVKQP